MNTVFKNIRISLKKSDTPCTCPDGVKNIHQICCRVLSFNVSLFSASLVESIVKK